MLIFQKSVDQFKGKTVGSALESLSTEVTDSEVVGNHQECGSRKKQSFKEVELWLLLSERHQNIIGCTSSNATALFHITLSNSGSAPSVVRCLR